MIRKAIPQFPAQAASSGCQSCTDRERANADAALAWWINSTLDWYATTEASCGPARAVGVTLDFGRPGSVPRDLAPAADAGPPR